MDTFSPVGKSPVVSNLIASPTLKPCAPLVVNTAGVAILIDDKFVNGPSVTGLAPDVPTLSPGLYNVRST